MARKSRKNPTNSTEKINFKVYKTAIYARLSKENQQGEKIESQIEEIKDYIKNRRIFELVDIYADNGYSGTNFDEHQKGNKANSRPNSIKNTAELLYAIVQ